MTIQETVDLIIDEAITRAREQADEAIDKVNEAMQAASQLIIPFDPGDPGNPVGIIPDPPTADYAAIFKENQDEMKNEILSQSNAEFNQFLNDYFPITLNAIAVAWMEDSILNGGTGIAPNVEDAIYNRGEERINEKMDAATEDVTEEWSVLGWSSPPGALASKIRRIRQEALTAACELNRDIVVSSADLEQKNVQFAVAESTKLQTAVWSAADSFSQSITRAYGPAVASGDGISKATMAFYEQTLQYYRTFLFAEQFGHDQDLRGIDVDFRKNAQVIEVLNQKATRMTEAALGAARTLGDMSSASLAGQNTMASAVVKELA